MTVFSTKMRRTRRIVTALTFASFAMCSAVAVAQPGPAAEEGGIDPIFYVIGMFVVTLGFMGFGAKVLFPRGHRKRQEMLAEWAERFPFLAPLVNHDKRLDANMGELRALADEVNEIDAHRKGALKIDAHDLGKMASPVDETVDASFVEQHDIKLPSRGPHAIGPDGSTEERIPVASLELGNGDQQAETRNVAPLSQRLASVQGDDGVPFDAVSPDVKPQMKSLEDTAPDPISPADDSTTIDIEPPSDAIVANVLRQSGQLPALADDSEETIIRDSGGLPQIADPDEVTVIREDDGFDRSKLRQSLGLPAADRTARDNVQNANDPDATTKNYSTYDD